MTDIKDWRNWIFIVVCSLSNVALHYAVITWLDAHRMWALQHGDAKLYMSSLVIIMLLQPSKAFGDLRYWSLRSLMLIVAQAAGAFTMYGLGTLLLGSIPEWVLASFLLFSGCVVSAGIMTHTTERNHSITESQRVVILLLTSAAFTVVGQSLTALFRTVISTSA